MVVKADGPRCQGNCPNYGCLEAMASGTAIAREGLRAAEEQPDSGLGRALAAGREITGALVTEIAHDGDEAAREVLAGIGFWLGVGITNYVNIFNPEFVVLGGGALAAGDLRARDRRARSSPSAALRALARPGADRPRPLRHRGGHARRRGARLRRRSAARRRRCERGQARRLPDADRQPRGRHAAGPRRAARGRRRRLRGHPPHAHAARPLRGQRDARLLPRAQRARSGPASWCGAWPTARRWRWSPTRGCRWSPIPASCSCASAWPPGWRSRCCPGPRRRWRRWSPRRCRPTRGASSASCPRKRGELAELFAGARDARRLRVAAAGGGVAGRARRRRSRPPRRRLPGADEDPRGGRARQRARARRPLRRRAAQGRGRAGRRPGRRARSPTRGRRSTRCGAWSTPARGRGPRPRWSRSSPASPPTACTGS